MATTAPDQADNLNVREQIARIDKNQAEIQKLIAEANRINQAELGKLEAETAKIRAEARFHPLTLLTTAAGAGAALFAVGAAFVKVLG